MGISYFPERPTPSKQICSAARLLYPPRLIMRLRIFLSPTLSLSLYPSHPPTRPVPEASYFPERSAPSERSCSTASLLYPLRPAPAHLSLSLSLSLSLTHPDSEASYLLERLASSERRCSAASLLYPPRPSDHAPAPLSPSFYRLPVTLSLTLSVTLPLYPPHFLSLSSLLALQNFA